MGRAGREEGHTPEAMPPGVGQGGGAPPTGDRGMEGLSAGAGWDENIYVPLNGINRRYKGQIGELNESCMVRKNHFLAFCTR